MTRKEQQKDDIETMKILFNADINELFNQLRFNDAREMEGIRDRIIQALEQQPSEDCISRQAVIDTIGNVPDHNDGMVFEALSHAQRDVALLPSVTPRTNLAETSQDCISREEMLKYQQYLHGKMSNEENHKLWNFIKGLPSVTPKYTDEEIDKAQAVEQAYVDKMVELAVKEIKRPKGHWIIIDDCELFMAKCSECGEIVDSRMINNYPYCHCGAEMSGGGEDG